MKILRITRNFYPLVGGQENHIYNSSRRIVLNGHEVHVLTLMPQKSLPRHEVRDGIFIWRAPTIFQSLYNTRIRLLFFIFSGLVECVKINRQGGNFDIVIGHDYWSGIIGYLSSRIIFKSRFIYFSHGVFQKVLGRLSRSLEVIFFRLLPFDYLVCVDDGTGGNSFFLNKIKVKKDAFSFIRHGIDTSYFQKHFPGSQEFLRAKYEISDPSLIVISTSKVNSIKGIRYPVSGYIKFLESYTDHSNFVICNDPCDGEFEEWKVINELIDQSRFKKNFVFTHSLEHGEVRNLLGISDVWVSMATYSNLGNALLEAMSCSLPVIVSDVGGTSTVVIDGVTGILVGDKDTSGFSKKLLYLAQHRSEREKMGHNARNFVTSNFSWDTRVDTELKIYRKTLDQQ